MRAARRASGPARAIAGLNMGERREHPDLEHERGMNGRPPALQQRQRSLGLKRGADFSLRRYELPRLQPLEIEPRRAVAWASAEAKRARIPRKWKKQEAAPLI
jgi:hypothetical protein